MEPAEFTAQTQGGQPAVVSIPGEFDQPKTESSKMIARFSKLDVPPFEIIRFYPQDAESQRFMHLLLGLADKGALDSHNMQFLYRTGRKIKVYHQDPKLPDELEEGFFSVGWYGTYLFGPQTFTFGRGNATQIGPSVDILLVPPEDLLGERIAAIHLILELHPHSGAWMVQPLSDIGVGRAEFVAGQLTCLSEAETTITIRNLVYVAEFMVKNPEQDMQYLQIRRKALQASGKPYHHLIAETKFSAIPFRSDPRLDIAIPHRGLGFGAHGTVFSAFDPKTGEPRAVKRMEVKNPDLARAIEQEVSALRNFQTQWGIVKIYGFRNRYGGNIVPQTYPEDFYIVMEKGISFKQLAKMSTIHKDSVDLWRWRAWLTMNLLVGLEAIHLQGAIHRDINWQNLLYFDSSEGQRPRAVLADFGKCIFSKSSCEENIGNRYFLPPEIETGKGNEYGQAIDIWMLGFALIQTFWPFIRDNNLPPYIGENWQRIMMEIKATEPDGQGIAHILWSMIMPYVKDRATASQAIESGYFCWYLSSNDFEYINSRRYRGN